MKRKILQFKRGILEVREEEIKRPSSTIDERRRFLLVLNKALAIGGRIVIPIVGGTFLGVYLDKLFFSSPKFTILFLLIGVILGFSALYQLTKEL